MNDNKRKSFYIWIVIILILGYFNIPQWLLCYVRQSFTVYPVNALIFNADVFNDKDNILPDNFAVFENFGNDKESQVTIKRFNNNLKAEIHGVAYNTNNINILSNYEDYYNLDIKTEIKESSFLNEKYFLVYSFKAEIPVKEGINKITIEINDKKHKKKEINYYLTINQVNENVKEKGINL